MHEARVFGPVATVAPARRPPPLRIALVTDSLVTVGGAEQVFLYMAEEFAEADIFTLAYRPKKTLSEFGAFRVHPSWADRLIANHRLFKLLFAFSTLVMQWWKLGNYDVVLISSASTAKYVARSGSVHICYCYFPTRALWSPEEYFSDAKPGIVTKVFRFALPWLRRRELAAIKRIDKFVAISETTREMIASVYGRPSETLFCPIPVDRFRLGLSEEKADFFLLVSRLERWKRVDYAIEAFNRLGLPLHIIGVGEEYQRLRAMAGPTITFLGRQTMDELVRQYGRARAVIFTPALEYGLVPLEAAAAGTPVIALGYGGVLETMVGVEQGAAGANSPTAVFFSEQTAESLMDAVRLFETVHFDRKTLSAYADTFGVPAFKARLRKLVETVAEEEKNLRLS